MSNEILKKGSLVKIKKEWLAENENPENIFIIMSNPEDQQIDRCMIAALESFYRFAINPLEFAIIPLELVSRDMLLDLHKTIENLN